MSKIILGTAQGHNVGFDIPELLVSRLLVQANSGGGKSFLLRRMLEQAYGKVQSIVIDPAGEFATLREKFGFVLVGEHGETPADVRSAAKVATKLLELHASAVCDLYSLKPHERHTWVKLFLAAVMNAPKRLWHPVIFVVDEAHKFCPEKGEGESEAKPEMLSLASDGRKYGFCAAWATQRLAKLDKSAASELTNVLIGPTFMDIDLQRAHKALGIVPKEQAAFNAEMKTLAPGYFWALGRAISKTRILVRIGAIETTHPTAGGKQSAEPPPAPEKIKALLPQLADLPQQAESEARTEAEFRREIRELKSKVSAAEKAAQNAAAHVAHTLGAKPAADPAKLQRQIETQVHRTLKQRDVEWNAAVRLYQRDLGDKLKETGAMLSTLVTFHFVPPISHANAPAVEVPQPVSSYNKPAQPSVAIARLVVPRAREPRAEGEVRLGAVHVMIAGILAGYYPEPVKISILAALCGLTMGGSFSARLSEVRTAGLLEDPARGYVKATEKCAQEYLGKFQVPSNTEEVIAMWEPKWGKVHRDIMQFLVAQGGDAVSKEQLAEAVGMTMGGSFSARLSEVRSSGLLSEPGRGLVAANKEALFLNGDSPRAREA
jgi:hypothetical protein